MAFEVLMPNLGLSIAEGTIEKWLKKEGDVVEKGDLVVVITTEKVTVEIPAEVSGTLLKIFSPAGSTVKVGEVIASIGEAGEKADPLGPRAAPAPSSPGSSIPPSGRRPESREFMISPLALRIAQEQGGGY